MRQMTQTRPPWVDEHAISADEFFYHVNGEIQPHFEGHRYNKRLFFIDAAYDFETNEQFKLFARSVAVAVERNINVRLNRDSRITVPDSDDTLVQIMDDSVFADVAGRSAALEKLLMILGENYDKETQFEENADLIYSFFRRGSIPRDVGILLGAPPADMEEPPIYNPTLNN